MRQLRQSFGKLRHILTNLGDFIDPGMPSLGTGFSIGVGVAPSFGGAQPNLSQGYINNIEVPICSITEQQEIVNQIEKHFSIIDKLEAVVQQSIKESKRLRQSILKQAFEGKLVEQDPNDESASLLLEKIAKAKEEYQKAMKRKK